MSRANQMQAGFFVFGVCLLVATVMGANKLLHPDDPSSAAPAAPAKAAPGLDGGVIVIGTADSDPPPTMVGPPALAALASVTKVLVKEGDVVKPGDPLVQFDDRIPQAKKKEAEAELAAAEQDAIRAKLATQNNAISTSRQENAVQAARDDLKEAENAYAIALDSANKLADAGFNPDGTRLSKAQKDEKLKQDLELRKVGNLVVQARHKVTEEQLKLDATKLLPADAETLAKQAEAKVDRLKATVEQAAAAVEECVVRARVGGIVEQVVVTPGVTIGPATRGPLMWIIPTGGRVVRAEVEAEFAARIADKVNKKVTVYDHSNFDLTYEGVVRRLGTAYLTKRSAADSLVGGQSRVLECLIDVPDPTPAGKPPLRVGQPVRVSFPDK